MNSDEEKITLPLSLILLEGGVAGVRFEIYPLLLKNIKSQEDLYIFGNGLMNVIGYTYTIQQTGSAMWVIYTHFCNKDIIIFIDCVSTLEKQLLLKKWLSDIF